MSDEPLLSYCERLVPQALRQRTWLGNTNVTSKTKKKVILEEPQNRSIADSSRYDLRPLNPTPELTTYGGIKLGWIQGVLIPCLLNIWGVMLFLRIAWIVAQAGIGLTIAIISISSAVCIITTLSLSAICTNGAVSGGGVYYLVSRSLGAELGASVGLIFAFANAVAASMNTIGFCDSLNDLLRNHGLKIIDNSVNDVRIVGAIALFVMCVICAIGMDWETKTQNLLITIIVIAILNYMLGSFIGPKTDIQRAKGFVGINAKTSQDNWLPDFRQGNDFFSVFAIYFPAVTGVQAGANICGDLRNPAEAIPKGTLTALSISITSYLAMAVLAGTGALRDASGSMRDLRNATLSACQPNCKYGLHNNYEIMQLMAFWAPLIYGGCWAATLSTALTNLLSVPRLIQALGVDRVYPGLIFFSKPYGKHGEPYRGYVLTFLVSLSFLLIADLDTIAPLITNFYLASYALINFCTFHAAFIHHISWRPTFRYYNTWLSLTGFLMCASIMVVISWFMALITVIIFGTLYLYVLYNKPETSWGSSTDAYRYREAITAILTMTRQTEHTKDYNPRVLALTGKPAKCTALLDIAHLVTKTGSFMVVAEVDTKSRSQEDILAHKKKVRDWMSKRKYRAFFVMVEAATFEAGVRVLVQCVGLGRLSPNILLLGYKTSWAKCSHDDLSAYVRVLRYGYEQQLALCILRVPEFHRFDSVTPAESEIFTSKMPLQAQMHVAMYSNSDISLNESDDDDAPNTLEERVLTPPVKQPSSYLPTPAAETIYRSNLHKSFSLNYSNNLDAWWLYDDGGLNILMPYIIAERSTKNKMPLRIFALAKEHHKPEEAQKLIEDLLAMFRIEYSELILINGISNAPCETSRNMFNSLIQDFRKLENSDCIITDEELAKHSKKTRRHLRLRELLLENSLSAGLIVMSLPVPRKGAVSAPLYMAWLEVLSRGLPPMLFVRGNDNLVIQT